MKLHHWIVIGVYLCIIFVWQTGHAEDFAIKRRQLMEIIHQDVELTSRYLGKPALDDKVMAALGKVERHRFVAEGQMPYSYENRPLPIGYGQTISQPYIVAIMTDLLSPEPDDVVLEVGTGSGYQAAVLGELVKQVYSLEIIEPLAKRAQARLSELDYDNVDVRVADGYYGLEQYAPFDGIIVTAAASHVPPPLLRQLKAGGRMIIPVGSKFQIQQLTLIHKNEDGTVSTRQVLPVRFVPFTGEH